MKALKNWQTTAWGFLGGVAYYLTTSGVAMPTDQASLGNLIVALLVAGLGAAAKDGVTGSAPGAVK